MVDLDSATTFKLQYNLPPVNRATAQGEDNGCALCWITEDGLEIKCGSCYFGSKFNGKLSIITNRQVAPALTSQLWSQS